MFESCSYCKFRAANTQLGIMKFGEKIWGLRLLVPEVRSQSVYCAEQIHVLPDPSMPYYTK